LDVHELRTLIDLLQRLESSLKDRDMSKWDSTKIEWLPAVKESGEFYERAEQQDSIHFWRCLTEVNEKGKLIRGNYFYFKLQNFPNCVGRTHRKY
jgi:hypothetical protein